MFDFASEMLVPRFGLTFAWCVPLDLQGTYNGPDMLSRKELLKSIILAGAASVTPMALGQGTQAVQSDVSLEDLKSFEKIAGITFTDDERKEILTSVRSERRGFDAVRKLPIDYTTEPRTVFTPIGGVAEEHPKFE